MGRPLNSRYFGPEAGKIRMMFHNGDSVVEGYVVKQTGTHRYQVTTDGVNIHEVELAQSRDEAENLVEGRATIGVKDKNGITHYVTKLESVMAKTSSGVDLSWSVDGEGSDSDIIVDTFPAFISIFDGNLSDGALKNVGQNRMHVGSGNYGNRFHLSRSEQEGLEIAAKIHKYRGNVYGTVMEEDGYTKVVIPAEPVTVVNEINRASWVVTFSLLAGQWGVESKLDDFTFTLTLDLDPSVENSSHKVVLTRNSESSWVTEDGREILVLDQTVPQTADVGIVDQNAINIAFNSMDDWRPALPPTWGEDGGEFDVELRATKEGKTVGLVKIKVVAQEGASW